MMKIVIKTIIPIIISVKQMVLVQSFTCDFQIYKKGYPQTPKTFTYTP